MTELRTARLVPEPYRVFVYDVDWGWRIDIVADDAAIRLRAPADPGLIGALGLERIGTEALSGAALEALGACTSIYQTHVFLQETERRRGLGIALYALGCEFALSRDFCLVSSDEPSDSARRLWKSRRLRELFHIERIGGRFVLLGAR